MSGLAYMNPPKPVDLASWWLLGQSPDEYADWYERARKEQIRMIGTVEGKKGHNRRAVDELREY